MRLTASVLQAEPTIGGLGNTGKEAVDRAGANSASAPPVQNRAHARATVAKAHSSRRRYWRTGVLLARRLSAPASTSCSDRAKNEEPPGLGP